MLIGPLSILPKVGAVQADIFWNQASEKSQVSIICKKTVEKLMYKSNVCSQLSSVITYAVFPSDYLTLQQLLCLHLNIVREVCLL